MKHRALKTYAVIPMRTISVLDNLSILQNLVQLLRAANDLASWTCG